MEHNEMRKRLEALSPEEREKRFQELRRRLGLAHPTPLSADQEPSAVMLEDHDEYQLLKMLLGYD